MSPSSSGGGTAVAPLSTPSHVTILRVKRPRTSAPLSALNVALPIGKRGTPRLSNAFNSLSLGSTDQKQPHLRFRRLAASRARTALLSNPDVTVVDVDSATLRRGVKRPADGVLGDDNEGDTRAKVARVQDAHQHPQDLQEDQQQHILCNGLPMTRLAAEEEDLYVQDAQRSALGVGNGDVESLEGPDDPSSDGEMAYLRAEDLPEFVIEVEESEDEPDDDRDFDAESVDYPSTPESAGDTLDDDDDGDPYDHRRRRPFGVPVYGGDPYAYGLHSSVRTSDDDDNDNDDDDDRYEYEEQYSDEGYDES